MVDEDGRPVELVRIMVVRLERVPNAEARPGEQGVRAAGLGRGVSAWSSDQSGLTTFCHDNAGVTNKSGEAEIFDATARGLMVRYFPCHRH